ncbi:type II/IV secretion system protein [Geovibrio thiophilus]|uniref:Type II/IV secretion system protein n=1 Tax=Geovibrio thiophilus TaxID=139438 RepID=A0A3R5X299_9BACT|nr:GspE/PulE family protein [Geovibrio thiophilus]QAR32733.1 type II/IV secretion system protein [Geovibrio thiophilus]
MHDKQLGQLLIEMGYLTEEQLGVALDVQRVHSGVLGDVLTSLAFVSSAETAMAVAKQAGKKYTDISDIKPDKELLSLFGMNTLKDLSFIPFDKNADTVRIAAADPFDINVADTVRRKTGFRTEIHVADRESILRSIEMNFYLIEKPVREEISRSLTQQTGTDTPALLDNIMKYAVTERATDIHISPEAVGAHIFFRTDGIMRHCFAVPASVHSSLISRIKILSQLDIAEQRLPQDGSMTAGFFGEEYDIRVSTIPTAYGENAVLRLLGKNLSMFSLESLGFDEQVRQRLEKCFAKPHGIFLVTGPTGSGKTTTLYSALRRINALERRILTVEDPIEYRFPFIKQTQVNEKAGYRFASAMRAFLRQDPDVILLGEMRDGETAEIAMRAAITGHLVLSTMHTNDAVTAIPRLLDLKIKNYLIASGVSGIMAQRLVRKVCRFCAEQRETDVEALSSYGIDPEIAARHGMNGKILLPEPQGCPRCGQTGYSGRTVISEFLETDAEIQDMIIKGATPNEIHENAVRKGMLTMLDDGFLKAAKGITTLGEIRRVAVK